MKLKAALLITVTVIATAVALLLGYRFINPSVSAQSTGTAAANNPASTASSTATTVPVTTVTAVKGQDTSMNFVGTVKALDQIKVLPAAAGQVVTSKVSNGTAVHQGDLLFEIGGINGTEHPLQSQFDLAQTNLNNAQKAVDAVKEGNDAALKAAQLQVQSAEHQAQSLSTDLNVFNRNIDAADSSMSILQDSLDTTNYNNQQNLDKASLAIQSLQDSLQELKVQKTQALDALYDQQNNTDDQTQRDQLQTTINSTNDDFDQKIRDLDTQLQTAAISYNNATAAAQLAENQLQGQLAQTQAQQDVLNLNRDSLATKSGYNGQTTDAVGVAQEGVVATLAKNKTSLLQTQSQLDIAKVSLDTAKNQLAFLEVRAPVDGIIDQISIRPGDLVSTQSVVAQVVNPHGFELNVGVNPDDVSNINKAEIQIGGQYLDVPVKSVSPLVDPVTKLVNVTLGLPNIFFRANQMLSTRLTFNQPAGTQENSTIYMVPVDALVIGDNNEKYIFIDNNGQARKTPVTVGNIDGDQVAILSGLQDNDQIIVQGSQDLTDGQTVTVN